MIDRRIISIAGPPGSGKTTFIERLLKATDGWVPAVRCHREPDLEEPGEASPARDPELRRYRGAGASGASVYRFPRQDGDAFFCAGFMVEPSDVLLEGERPVDYVELEVFVAPVPAPRKRILRRVKRNFAREHREQKRRLMEATATPESTLAYLESEFGRGFTEVTRRNPEMLESFRSRLRDLAPHSRPAGPGPGERAERWLLAEPWAGIERAGLVVLNARGPEERGRGERALEEVLRLRKDPQVFENVLGHLWRRTPITAVVADLGDAGDAGLKKAIQRCKRSLRKVL